MNELAHFPADLFDPPPTPVAQRTTSPKARVSTGTFFNTIGAEGEDLAKRKDRAASQETILYEFFLAHPGEAYAPSYLAGLLFPDSPPTSPRRALRVLTKAQWLEKTPQQKPGPWGDPEHLWRLNPNRPEGKP